MELLRSYNSDETFSEDCGSFQEALGEKEVRSCGNNNDNSHHVLGVLQSLFCPQKHSGLIVDG